MTRATLLGSAPRTRGLHSSTSQPILSRFSRKIHPRHPLIPQTPLNLPKQPMNASTIPQKALTMCRKVDECKPLPRTTPSLPLR